MTIYEFDMAPIKILLTEGNTAVCQIGTHNIEPTLHNVKPTLHN